MVFYILILFFRIVEIFVIARVLKNMKKKFITKLYIQIMIIIIIIRWKKTYTIKIIQQN